MGMYMFFRAHELLAADSLRAGKGRHAERRDEASPSEKWDSSL